MASGHVFACEASPTRREKSDNLACSEQCRPGLRSSRSESSVHVVARFRPRVTEEELQDKHVFSVHPSGRIVESLDGSYCFELDKVFTEATRQEDVYDYVGRPIIHDVLSGYNGTILAYGPTGSGKTYCMFGPGSVGEGFQSELRGVIPRAAHQIFDTIADITDDRIEFTLRCSFMEVYREQMRDLLNPFNQKLRVKELPQTGLFVDGLSREYVTCISDVMNVLRAGYRSRSVARTRQNQYSSRSHAIFVLHVEQRSDSGSERLGKLTLVDLAGSEKVSKSESIGDTLEEAKKINWSLTALGKVIDALAERRPHVPYRDSRLTRVLEEALGGNCRTTLLVAASACSQHYDETISSMRFATRAKKVRNVAKVNYVYSSDQLLMLVASLQRDLLRTKRQLCSLTGTAMELQFSATTLLSAAMSPASKSAALERNGLSDSRSVPALHSFKAEEDNLRKVSSASLSDVFSDIDEALSGTKMHSSSSCRLFGSVSRPEISDEMMPVHSEEGDEASDGPPTVDEDWRSVALTARDTIWSMQAALKGQEQVLEEVRLLKARQEDDGLNERPQVCSPSETARGSDLLFQRFKALQYAAQARSLSWRLQLEKYRSESLSLELEMRTHYAEDLERSLSEAHSQLAKVQYQDLKEPTSLSVPKASCGSLGRSLRRSPTRGLASPDHYPSNEVSCGSGPRITRPVPRRNLKLESDGPPSLPASKDAATLFSSILSGLSVAAASGESPHGSAIDSVLWVAGTGDTGSECFNSVPTCDDFLRGGATEASSAARAAAESRVQDLERQLADANARAEAAQHLKDELEAKLISIKAGMDMQHHRMLELRGELGVRDVRIASLRHEVRVKDALLGSLKAEALHEIEQGTHELQSLMEQALSALAALLTRQHTAAFAVGAPGGKVGR